VLTNSGRCDTHRKQHALETYRARGTRTQRGYSNAWLRASAGFLRTHPLCRLCEQDGRVTAAKVTDHIVPHKMDMSLFWDTSNWQPLCKACHDAKTAREDGGFGNA